MANNDLGLEVSEAHLDKLKKARWYAERNRTYKACLLYFDLLKQNPNSFEIIDELADIYAQRNEVELSIICYEALHHLEPWNVDILLNLAHCLVSGNRPYRALLVLSLIDRKGTELYPVCLALKTQIYAAIGNDLELINSLNELIQISGGHYYYIQLAQVLDRLGLDSCLLETCKRGLKKDPYNRVLLRYKAKVHLGYGEFQEAKKIYIKMIKNHLYTFECKADIDNFLVQFGPIKEVVELLSYFDDYRR